MRPRWSCSITSAWISNGGARFRRQPTVYAYIAARDPNYRDLRARRARVKETRYARTAAEPQAPPQRAPPEVRPAIRHRRPCERRGTRRRARSAATRSSGNSARARWASVYLGRDPKINRVVAIKAIPLARGVRGGRSRGSSRAVFPRGRNGRTPQSSRHRHGLRCGRRPGTGLYRHGVPARSRT